MEEEFLIQVKVCLRNKTDTVMVTLPSDLLESDRGEEAGVLIKNAICDWFDVNYEERHLMWLVFRGKRIKDCELMAILQTDTLSSILYAGIGLSKVQSGGGHSIGVAFPHDMTGVEQMLNVQNIDFTVKKPKNFVESMIENNSDLMVSLVQANPKVKALMDKDPNLRHALSDPSTIKDIIRSSTDPKAHQELLRSQDLALSNITNMPGGMQALQHFYNLTESIDSETPQTPPDALSIDKKYQDLENGDLGDKAVIPNPWSTQEIETSNHQKSNEALISRPWGSSFLGSPAKHGHSTKISVTGTSTKDAVNVSRKSNAFESMEFLERAFLDSSSDNYRQDKSFNEPMNKIEDSFGNFSGIFNEGDNPKFNEKSRYAPENNNNMGPRNSLKPKLSVEGSSHIDLLQTANSFNYELYEGRFESELRTLEDMGFRDRRKNLRVLLLTGGNLDLAVDRLMSSTGE